MASLEQTRHRLDRWMNFVPYGALICSALLVVIAGGAIEHLPYPVIAVVVVVALAWLLWWSLSAGPHGGRYFAGLLLLIYLLVWCSPLFGFFAWVGYSFTVYTLHGRWRVVGGTGVAIATATAQAGGYSAAADRSMWPVLAMLLLFNAVIANAMIFLTTMTHRTSSQRARMIDELNEANTKLAAALRENAGLHAQLLVQAREAGIHDERQRMAGEIHDVLAQGLTGIVTQLEAAAAAEERPAERRRHLHNAKQLARDGLTEARRSVQAMRPQTLDTSALPEAIDEVVTGWSEINGVRAELITTGAARPLLPEIETTLLRTAQEALANVARHADAGRVALTLSYMEDVVTLDVRDDGAGFDPADPVTPSVEGGYGLAAMRDRLARIAGTLAVESEPGNGTALSACVPAITVGAAA